MWRAKSDVVVDVSVVSEHNFAIGGPDTDVIIEQSVFLIKMQISLTSVTESSICAKSKNVSFVVEGNNKYNRPPRFVDAPGRLLPLSRRRGSQFIKASPRADITTNTAFLCNIETKFQGSSWHVKGIWDQNSLKAVADSLKTID